MSVRQSILQGYPVGVKSAPAFARLRIKSASNRDIDTVRTMLAAAQAALQAYEEIDASLDDLEKAFDADVDHGQLEDAIAEIQSAMDDADGTDGDALDMIDLARAAVRRRADEMASRIARMAKE